MESGGVSDGGGSRGAEGASGAGGAEGAKGAGESGGISGGEARDVSSAAAEVSDHDVSAQADAVAGKDTPTDGFDRAEAAGPGRGPSEGTVAEGERRAAETEARAEADREATRAEALGRDRTEATADATDTGTRATPSEGTLAERERRTEEADAAREATREAARATALGRDPDAVTHRTPSEGTLAERARREENARVEGLADRLAAMSPRAERLLEQFRAAGGTFVRSEQGGWFDTRSGRPVIGVPQGTANENMRTIAHELGHFDFRSLPDGAYQPPGRPTGLTDRQIEHRRQADYITNNVNARLADEGHATLTNRQIRDEVLARTGVDLQVSGLVPDGLTRPGAAPPEVQRRTIGDYFGSNLITSTTGQNYRSYYGQAYIDHYARNHLPGQER